MSTFQKLALFGAGTTVAAAACYCVTMLKPGPVVVTVYGNVIQYTKGFSGLEGARTIPGSSIAVLGDQVKELMDGRLTRPNLDGEVEAFRVEGITRVTTRAVVPQWSWSGISFPDVVFDYEENQRSTYMENSYVLAAFENVKDKQRKHASWFWKWTI